MRKLYVGAPLNNKIQNLKFFGKYFFPILLVSLFVLLIFPTAAPAQLALAWDPNSEANLAGYRIYYGTSSKSYSWGLDVGNVTRYTVGNLTPGQPYYFAVTAYDISNYESGFSNEVSGTVLLSYGSLYITSRQGFFSSGQPGGPFNPSQITYSITNVGATPVNWSASNNRNWVSLSLQSGSLAPGASTSVTVSINANASTLALGYYTDTISFSNTTNGSGTTSRPIQFVAGNPAHVGIFRNGAWFFDRDGDGFWDECQLDQCISYSQFGMAGIDIPVMGDWTGNGVNKIAVYRHGEWFLDSNGNDSWDNCGVDSCVQIFGGNAGDIPVVGDWSGSGRTTIGIYRNGEWFLDGNGNYSWESNLDTYHPNFGGLPGDVPITGDWNGNGITKIGIYRNGQWFFDLNGNGIWDDCGVDGCIAPFGGVTGDMPVVGDWIGDGKSKIGIYRSGQWFLDMNGNGRWDGCDVDRCVEAFGGVIGDIPLVR